MFLKILKGNFMNLRNIVVIILFSSVCFAGEEKILKPVITGQWHQIAGNPDLGKYTGEKQEPVDFCIWQAADGTWQLWSCIRGTNTPGHNRLFHRWEGKNITDPNWTPMGIAMMSESKYSEPENGLQAPYVVKFKNKYWMLYGDWNNICLAVSKDGKKFERVLKNNSAAVFSEGGPEVNTRDPMLMWKTNQWYCYYTACPAKKGYVFCRTSSDLKKWSDSVVVSYGGSAGTGWASAECPQVIEPTKGNYYLFRNQYYGPGGKFCVYHSKNPFNFGIDDDSYLISEFNLSAPEIIKDGDKYYIAALNPNLDGIRIAPLDWR
ncbi:MAG TPA: hypothetical protein DCP47_00185 [Phycisphaerales bacterium]|nr:hypothetical protein [Phycisphaerales bacterium]